MTKSAAQGAAFFAPKTGWEMEENNNIRTIIEPAVTDLGYDIVRLKWLGGEKYKTLQIMIEPKDGGPTLVEDCEKVSHTVSALLDVDDVIEGAYRLEVSSPGIDRPLTRKKDFENWQGFEAKIETREAIEGRRKFRGTILKFADDKIEFELKDEKKFFTIPLAKVTEAKLVLTDELINHVTKNNAGREGYAEGNEVDINEEETN